MKKLLIFALLTAFSTNLRAVVVTFDDLPTPDDPSTTVVEASDELGNYGGLIWQFNAFYFDQTLFPHAPPLNGGYDNGVVSGSKAFFATPDRIVNLSPEFGSIQPIFFEGAYFTSAWNEGLTIEVTAEQIFNGSAASQSKMFTVDPYSPTWIEFNWANVSHLRMASFGGSPVEGFAGFGEHFIMDDFTYHLSPVPIPAAAWLFGSALIGLVGFSRRRKVD